ncbi:uncharacterized protein F5891DRAFT_950944 [Suillus fuscotomentosus]|uniref:Zn(2)-C6 fungal-type domain-containing protein n=1 Tax=Suillus fuscotomentosus TaxID=1912939 RepID=A0AAD4E7H7_9AGAM|nr:uncharacterized protein F5891DRAFT_950944 [Suillus fuscotomentosus]KAG1901089.1 hypothetical protein F5891DRAFT_950944 [Suillus fuscotomentosus]
MSSDSFQQPLQLKGEIMDLEFTVDTDHRKRRRNRTTQSCLNCHTSKRKCDRKRPCQRCIQLGLTGLCVYEIDDPALRDDPTIDEATRLRNRIAELESLVRELRGKPHPRWADANFRDGDPSERWHSRAAKNNMQLRRRGRSDDVLERANLEPRGLVSAAGAPIKIEPVTDISQPHLYRFTPSPPASYSAFHSDNSSSPPFERQNGHHYSNSLPSNGRSMPYSSPTSNQNMTYSHHHTDSSFQENGHVYPMNSAEQDKVFGNHFSDSPVSHSFCSCRTNPATGHALISLSHQLQSTLNSLRQYAQHPENTQCQLFRRIIELHDIMRTSGNDPDEASGSPYGTLPTPTESDILSSHSSSSTPFHGSSSASVSEWNAMASSRYNPYFPVSPTEQGLYSNIIT